MSDQAEIETEARKRPDNEENGPELKKPRVTADEEEAEQPTSSGDKNHDEQDESDGEFSDKDVEESGSEEIGSSEEEEEEEGEEGEDAGVLGGFEVETKEIENGQYRVFEKEGLSLKLIVSEELKKKALEMMTAQKDEGVIPVIVAKDTDIVRDDDEELAAYVLQLDTSDEKPLEFFEGEVKSDPSGMKSTNGYLLVKFPDKEEVFAIEEDLLS